MTLKIFKAPQNSGWDLTWTKVGADGGYAGLMFINNTLGQRLRIDDMNDGTYKVKGWGADGMQMFNNDYDNSKSAVEFTFNYMKSNTSTIKPSAERIRSLKMTLREATDRGVKAEAEIFDATIDEFNRVMNLIISNNNVPELTSKAKKLKQLVNENV